MRKTDNCICEIFKNKAQVSCTVTAQMISTFVFASCIVQCLLLMANLRRLQTKHKMQTFVLNVIRYTDIMDKRQQCKRPMDQVSHQMV